MKKKYRLFHIITLVLLFTALFTVTTFASGNVSTAIQGSWDSAKEQIKTTVDNVVFPALSLILAVLFFVKLGGAYFDYRKHGQFEFIAPLILFICLLFTLTAKNYIWQIIS